MKLEDLTKEELINFIRRDWRVHGAKEESIVRDCLWDRLTKIEKKLSQQGSKVIWLLQEYSDFLKPYKNIMDIPEHELPKGVKIEKALKQARSEEEKLRKQCDKLHKILFD